MADAPSPPSPPPPPPAVPYDVVAAALALVLVAVAIGAGMGFGRRAAPPPTPTPVAALATPRPTPTPESAEALQARAFAQPLSAGCSTGEAVWLFSDGGAAIRFDGERWTIPDPTLRSHLAAACRPGEATVVGRGGSVLHVDDDQRALRVDSIGVDDLTALVLLPDGVLAVGDRGTVLRQTVQGWANAGPGVTGDLRGVAVATQAEGGGRAQAWIVGVGGSSYRLLEGGWDPVPTGTSATLMAVVIRAGVPIAVGERGTIIRFADGRWTAVASATDASLRAAVVRSSTVWIVGDRGTALELSGDEARRVDLGTACTLRAVFTQDSAIWIVGSDGARGAAWRVSESGTATWGSCG